MSEFSIKLRAERKRLGLSQTAVALATGVTQQTQAKYEKGISLPNIEYLQVIKTLGFNLLHLMDLEYGANQAAVKPRIIDLSVMTYKEVEVSTMDDDGVTPNLSVRIKLFREKLESEIRNLS